MCGINKECACQCKKTLREARVPENTITITCDDSEGELLKLLTAIKAVGNTGHSFSIIVDPDEKEGLSERTFYWDGDGSDYIKDIKSIKNLKEKRITIKKVTQYLKEKEETYLYL